MIASGSSTKFLAGFLWVVAGWLASGTVWAGGSGLNVIVVINANSTNSIQLGNAYCEQREVPPQNVFRMSGWTGGAVTWSQAEFETCLRNPLLAMVASRGLTNQAEIVLLSMDIPYRVTSGGSANSTTSALFYGFKNDASPPGPGLPASCSLPDSSSNSFAFSEMPFSEAPPDTAPTNSFLAMMLTDTTLNGAQLILSRGVAGDSSFPAQTVYLAKTSDVARNVRYVEFDNAVFDTHIRGDNSLVVIDTDSTSFTNLLGLLTGLAQLTLPADALVAGGMGDSLTSFAGDILESSGQTSLLAFLEAGAAASYGTVIEPCNYVQKFPNPEDYFYQDRGFSMVESYYQSLLNPYQGLLAGEPLSAPFARPGSADWSSLTNGTLLRGQAPLSLAFYAAATNLPLGRVDLFVDGKFFQDVTNLPPIAGDVLSVILNGFTVEYPVPSDATVASTVTGLATALNAQTNTTRVLAFSYGDRLELDSLDIAAPGSQVTLSATTEAGAAAQSATFLTPAQPAFLDSIAAGYFGLGVSNTPAVGDWVLLDFFKTNGTHVTVGATNTVLGATIGSLTRALLNEVNATGLLQSSDGVLASDFFDSDAYGIAEAGFNLYARSAGWPAAQIQAALSASTNLVVLAPGTNRLEDNLSDLRPRNHLYVSSGATMLPVSFVCDTTQLPDGFHDLTAVAYEGTSVRTQTRVSRTIQVQNTSLSAVFTPLLTGTNATLDLPLEFSVNANQTNIARIELFSTGGSIGAVSNQSAAVFLAPSASLGLGLHPFYALVTDTLGNQYRTQTAWVRLIPSFVLTLSGPPLALSWAAIPGLQYEVLVAASLSSTFQRAASVTASNSLAQWPIPAPNGAAAFYRVRLAP
jgi:uncharacterized protein (TIGR03790 family)